MKSLYVTSIERYSGKTATCLALGMHFKADGYKVGYLKPLSLQPWRLTGPGGVQKVADEDAAFVKETLGLSEEAWDMSTVVLTQELLLQQLKSEHPEDLMQKVKTAYAQAASDKDIFLLEGGGSLREGYMIGLPTPEVARALSSQVLVIVRYQSEIQVLDDVLATQFRLGEVLCGVIFNRVPVEALTYVTQSAAPYLEKKGIPVFGALPEARGLSALTVG